MGVKTYNPKAIVATLGPCILRGFAPDSMIRASRNADDFSMINGADGEVTRVESADKSGSVTFSLAGSSQANDELSALVAAGAVVPLTVRDLGGTTLLYSPNAWLRRPADVELGKDPGPREWIADCDALQMHVGGTVRGSLLDVES